MSNHPETETTPPGLLKQGFDAFKANAPAAVLLWIVGTAIVAGYYTVETFRGMLDDVAAFKDRIGLIYPVISMAVFCGLIPYLLQGLQHGDRRNWSPVFLIFLMVFWGYKGLEVELLYRAQAAVFGHDNQPLTIAMKLLVDQLVYVPLLAVPGMVLALSWANRGYSWSGLRNAMRGNWYCRLVLPVMIPNWFVWFPSVILIYALPTGLQLPVQNIIACMWALMVMFLTHAGPHDETT